jgi:transcriptional regulator GlxA family with amidase domain
LARTGLLDGKNATSNKIAFDWVMTNGKKVNWIRKARWIVDGKYYTSSGVSAGMDMTLDFLKVRHGIILARQVAEQIEYGWTEDGSSDPFYKEGKGPGKK